MSNFLSTDLNEITEPKRRCKKERNAQSKDSYSLSPTNKIRFNQSKQDSCEVKDNDEEQRDGYDEPMRVSKQHIKSQANV